MHINNLTEAANRLAKLEAIASNINPKSAKDYDELYPHAGAGYGELHDRTMLSCFARMMLDDNDITIEWLDRVWGNVEQSCDVYVIHGNYTVKVYFSMSGRAGPITVNGIRINSTPNCGQFMALMYGLGEYPPQ